MIMLTLGKRFVIIKFQHAEYHANEYNWKAYTTGASDSANSARLLTFTADAEL